MLSLPNSCPYFYLRNELNGRIVNVILQSYSYDRVLAELARCLALFPNLHTLQVFGLGMRRQEITYKVFKGLTFPQIRTLVVPSSGYHILAACPNVKNVTCIGMCFEKFWETLFAHCPNVVSLGTFAGTDCTTVLNGGSTFIPKFTFNLLTYHPFSRRTATPKP
jgi:hypothetical protein